MLPVLYVVAALLAIVGISTVIKTVVLAVYKSNWKSKLIHIVVLDNTDPEIALREAKEQVSWSGVGANESLFAVDMGLSSENRRKSEILCADYGIGLYLPDELLKIIRYLD